MDFFKLYEEVADWAWQSVQKWPPFAKQSIGHQLVTAIDSVNANLAEGDGRSTDRDGSHFFVIARASARESRLWIQRAIKRQLCEESEGAAAIEKLTTATKKLNVLINYRRSCSPKDRVRETQSAYPIVNTPADCDDPFIVRDDFRC